MNAPYGKNGKAHVLEISNRANIQTLNVDAVTSINSRIDNHIGISNSNAHEIQNIYGLQSVLDGKASSSHTHSISNIINLQDELNNKANTFTGYTGSIDVIIGIDFTTQSVTKKTLNISNGVIESII